MNKKTISAGILASMAFSAVLFTTSASAFWPFDGLFSKGEVKAAKTDERMAISKDNSEFLKLNETISSMATLCKNITGISTTLVVPTVTTSPMPTVKTGVVGNHKGPDTATNTKKMLQENTANNREANSVLASLKSICASVNKLSGRYGNVYKKVGPIINAQREINDTEFKTFDDRKGDGGIINAIKESLVATPTINEEMQNYKYREYGEGNDTPVNPQRSVGKVKVGSPTDPRAR